MGGNGLSSEWDDHGPLRPKEENGICLGFPTQTLVYCIESRCGPKLTILLPPPFERMKQAIERDTSVMP